MNIVSKAASNNRRLLTDQLGMALPMILSMIIAMAILTSAVLLLILSNLDLARRNNESQKALNIAEAGVNYYLWHLSHNSTDYRDGKTTPVTPDADLGYGPYVHEYVDDNAKNSGTYTLWVKPQGNGSTIMTVRSIGKTKTSSITRTVEAKIGAPSFASYGLLADSALWFGNTESANGPVHSNKGIRMDGYSSDNVTSANATYIPPSNLGGNGSTSRAGVWCDSSITTPVNCNTRNKNDWDFPVASVDFNQVSGSLCNIKKIAFAADSSTSAYATQSNACTRVPTNRTAAYLPQRSTTGSYNIARGYLIELNTNGTYNVSYVNDELDRNTPYTSALSLQAIASNIPIPTSGVIFAEDNVWIRTNPTFHGRVTIGAGRLATSSNAEIVIADDLVYSTKNGSDVIGLIAEDDITIAPYAPPATGSFNFEVDAALIAQSGSVQYPLYYRTSSSRCTRGWTNSNQTFTYYGSVSTRQTWTWTWLVGNSACGEAVRDSTNTYVTGINHNNTQYDYNLLYAPPPEFPITSTYNILSWREVLTKP